MPHVLQTICILSVFFLGSCKDEYSYEGGQPVVIDTSNNNEPPVKSEWEFKEGATHYKGPVDTAFLTTEDVYSVLTVTGKSENGAEAISLTIRGIAKIEAGKTYNTTRQEVRFSYKGSDTIYSAVPYKGDDIYLTITAITKNKVTGTFKGLAVNEEGRSYEIMNGKFSSPLKKVPASEAKGYIMLWAEEDCNGPIRVNVNNQPGEITSFSSIKPNCGDAGSATFNMEPGSYRWIAYCGLDSVVGTAELKAGSCTKVLVFFPIKPAVVTTTEAVKTCKVSMVNYTGELFPIMSNNINTLYAGKEASNLVYTVKVPGFAFPFTYGVHTEGNKIIITHPSGDPENYFVTDARGRVVEYYGNTKPDTLNSLTPEYVTYGYDAANNLVKRTFYKDSDRRPINEMRFTWEDGNITKLTYTSLINGSSLEYRFDYFMDKPPVKAMPFFYTQAQELLMYQSVINFGNPLKNIPEKMALVINPTTTYTYSFYGYVIDSNGYVQSMRLSHDASNKFIGYSFQYTCF